MLERRIGLIEVHANREAAHLSIEPYLFSLADMAHVVAAIALISTMIYDFDNAHTESSYFDAIDSAGWQAAKSIFPELALPRLFDNFDLRQQAASYWRIEPALGLQMILNQLPQALGWWDSASE